MVMYLQKMTIFFKKMKNVKSVDETDQFGF